MKKLLKKLTIKALKEMLKKTYLTGNFVEVIKLSNDFYVVYRDKVVTYHYAPSCGWCFSISGTSYYGDTKALVNLVMALDENFIGEIQDDTTKE